MPPTAPLFVVLSTLLFQVARSDYSVDVLLQRFVDAEGKLINGSYCDPFYFAGQKCNIQLKVCVELPGQQCLFTNSNGWYDLGQVASNDYEANFTKDKWYGAWFNPTTFNGTGQFAGFNIGVQAFSLATSSSNTTISNLIDQWVALVSNGSTAVGTGNPSHQRVNAQPTSLQLAWRAVGDVITPPPEPYTGPSTESPSTLAPRPFDCDGVSAEERDGQNEGVYELNVGNGVLNAYCLFGTNGAYTVIQNRGEGDNTKFDKDYASYAQPFGTPGPTNNFWFGLDNINLLTISGAQSYHLRVDVCCNTGHPAATYVYNVTVGNGAAKYVLGGTANNRAGLGAPGDDGADIGAVFSTRQTYDGELEYCDVINPNEDVATGGWWFRSCANNLNGPIVPANGTCNLINSPQTTGTGIEFWTSTNQIGATQYLEGKSYTRTRMAVYQNRNSIINGFDEDHLCKYEVVQPTSADT